MTTARPERSITLYGITEQHVEDARAALAAQAETLQRAATRAAGELDVDVDKKDKRPGALAIMQSLAQAARLTVVSQHLAAAWAASSGDVLTAARLDLPDSPAGAGRGTVDPAALRAELRRLNGETEPAADPVVEFASPEDEAEARAARTVPVGETAAGDEAAALATLAELGVDVAELGLVAGPPPDAPLGSPTNPLRSTPGVNPFAAAEELDEAHRAAQDADEVSDDAEAVAQAWRADPDEEPF